MWESVTVVRFVSWWGGVMVMGRSKRARGDASLGRKCNSHHGGVKDIKNKCQLIEICDGPGAGVRGWRGVMVIGEVLGGMTVVRKCDSPKEVCQLARSVMVMGVVLGSVER